MINGAKMFISMGNHAKLALVFAQTDPDKAHRGLACFLVDTDQPGYQPSAVHHKLGLRGSDTAEIALNDVEVPDDAMLGEIGDGFKVAMSSLDSGATASPPDASASARAASTRRFATRRSATSSAGRSRASSSCRR